MTLLTPASVDLDLVSLMQSLYQLKPGGSGDGPFNKVLREKTDYGVNVGIMEKPDSLILAFRGSVTLEDWVRDAVSFLPEDIPGVGTYPLGFSKGLEECRGNLDHWITSGKPLLIVGHSLGAAHAGIMGQILKRDGFSISRLVLMGCPNLIPSGKSGELIDVPTINYKNELDFVTDVPPDPWEPIVPFTDLSGGHADFPGLFMFHHIEYYANGISLAVRNAA